MKIRVVKDRCQGHAMCRMRAPQVYALDDHGYNVMDPFDVPRELEELAEEGAEACPERAIIVVRGRPADSAESQEND